LWNLAALLDELKCENPMARLKKVGQNNNNTGAAAKGGAADGGAAKEKKNEPKQSHVRFFLFEI